MTNIVDEQTSTLDSSTFNSPPFFGTSGVPKRFAQYDGIPCQHFSSYIEVQSTSFKSALMTPQHSNTILTRVQAQNSVSRALQKSFYIPFRTLFLFPPPTPHPLIANMSITYQQMLTQSSPLG